VTVPRICRYLSLVLLFALLVGCPAPTPTGPSFTFSLTADMRNFTSETEFRGALRALADAGAGLFMIAPGDIDPPDAVDAAIQEILGPAFDWYPVVGNHEAETPGDMTWLRAFNPGGTTLSRIVNPGPTASVETCYSFDEGNAHFAVINEYYHDAVDDDPVGDVSTELLAWLEADLAMATQPVIFVIGHEPAFPRPDMAFPNRVRHVGDSLDQFPAHRDRFWQTLVHHGVKAYLCGHTHNFSLVEVDGVWQIDVGHARGLADIGARSTFLRMSVYATGEVTWEAWRQSTWMGKYTVRIRGQL
jgi:hypothetical protein